MTEIQELARPPVIRPTEAAGSIFIPAAWHESRCGHLLTRSAWTLTETLVRCQLGLSLLVSNLSPPGCLGPSGPLELRVYVPLEVATPDHVRGKVVNLAKLTVDGIFLSLPISPTYSACSLCSQERI